MNRRGFLKGLTAFAALACAPGLSIANQRATIQTVLGEAIGGVIENRTFYLTAPIVLENIKNLTIRNCNFEYRGLTCHDPFITIGPGCDGLLLSGNVFISYDEWEKPEEIYRGIGQ